MGNPLRKWIGDDWPGMLALLLLLCLPVVTTGETNAFVGAILAVVLIGPFIAFLVLRHYSHTEPVKAFKNTIKDLMLGLWAIVKAVTVVGASLGALWVAYLFLYPHKALTSVYTNGNWMQGEKRDCLLATAVQPYELDCTVKERLEAPHKFDVTYTRADPADQDKNNPQSWTCTRETNSISCTFGR